MIADQIVKGGGRCERHVDFALGNASHRLLHEFQVVREGVQILANDRGHLLAMNASLGQVLVEELVTSTGVRCESFCDELLEIQNLDALLAKNLSKAVMLLLGDFQVRNVVKEQTLKLIGRKIKQLVAGAMQAHLLQLTDFARYMNTIHTSLLFPLSCRSSQSRHLHNDTQNWKAQGLFLSF